MPVLVQAQQVGWRCKIVGGHRQAASELAAAAARNLVVVQSLVVVRSLVVVQSLVVVRIPVVVQENLVAVEDTRRRSFGVVLPDERVGVGRP